jgi:hypothetical protein
MDNFVNRPQMEYLPGLEIIWKLATVSPDGLPERTGLDFKASFAGPER